MKTVTIQKSKIAGSLVAPASKSQSHRVLIAAALSDKPSIINNLSSCQDVKLTVKALIDLGAKIKLQKTGTQVEKGSLFSAKKSQKIAINCGHSGTTARFILGLASIIPKTVIIDGSKRLKQRPFKPLISILRTAGISIKELGEKGFLPVQIRGRKQLYLGDLKIDINQSSQFASSLLLISPLLTNNTNIILTGNHSRPYIDLTLAIMRKFGIKIKKDKNSLKVDSNQNYQPTIFQIEGDYSLSAFLFAAALLTGGWVNVSNLSKNYYQADKYYLDILQQIGAHVYRNNNKIMVSSPRYLSGLKINLGNYPDLVPAVAVLAIKTKTPIIMENIGHLKYKESDRLYALSKNLGQLGINVKRTPSSLTVYPGKVKGGFVSSYNDHRLVMSMAVAALSSDNQTTIKGADSVNKSYPNFFNDLIKIGASIL